MKLMEYKVYHSRALVSDKKKNSVPNAFQDVGKNASAYQPVSYLPHT